MNDIFKYRAPTSRAELFSLLAAHGEGARILAGGTDLLVDIRSGLVRPELVINLKKVEDFSESHVEPVRGADHRTRDDRQRVAPRRQSPRLATRCSPTAP